MPLYEFYCEPCHTVFTFRAVRVDTETAPNCPVCGHPLEREVSAFSHSVKGKRRGEPAGDRDGATRMDQAMARMGDRLQALADDDADPREAVKVMRELADAGGLHFNKDVQEAMARIEAGEDPERIDETFKEVFDTENPFEGEGADDAGNSKTLWRKLRGPRRDPRWYDFPD